MRTGHDCLRAARPGVRRGGRGLAMVLAVLGLAAGCGGSGDDGGARDEPLVVMAASSLNLAMPDLIARFAAETGDSVVLVLGATSNLAAQIGNGAPGDVFFAADQSTVDRMVREGSIRVGSEGSYAVGELALVWRRGAPRPASAASLADPVYGVIAIANPEVAPYGAAAREALTQLGIWEMVAPRIVLGETIAQTYRFVQTGNADAGLVARSVVDTARTEHILVDPALHEPIRQSAGILSRSEHPAAGAFLEFVLSPEGQAILGARGFGPADPGEAGVVTP